MQFTNQSRIGPIQYPSKFYVDSEFEIRFSKKPKKIHKKSFCSKSKKKIFFYEFSTIQLTRKVVLNKKLNQVKN